MADSNENAGIRWSRVLCAVLLVFAVGEVSSRVAIRLLVGEPFRSFDGYIFSGYGVFRQNPHYTHPSFVHNSVGFRNHEEFSVEKPERTLRVMGIGASVLYAGSAAVPGGVADRVQTDETITAYLGEVLRAMPELAPYDVEVINAGTNRHNLRNVIPYYAAELARYRPDIVLIFGTNNDARKLEHSGARDALFYDPNQPTGEEALLQRLANEATFAALGEKVVRVAVNRSAFAAVAYRIADWVLRRVNIAMARAMPRGAPSSGAAIASPEEHRDNLRPYLADLVALATLVQMHGAQTWVFWEYLLTTVEGIKPLSDYERMVVRYVRSSTDVPARVTELKLETATIVAETLAERGIPMIDLLEDFRVYDGTVFNDYLHYRAEGNRWVAERIAERIEPGVRAWVAAQ